MSMTRKEELKKQAYAEYLEVKQPAWDKYLEDIEEIDNNYDS